jgi:hypothetical protein
MKKIRNYHLWNAMPYKERSLYKVFNEIQLKCNGNNLPESDDLQKRFKILAEKCGQKYGGHSVKAFAPVSREFLHKHVDLLE